MAEEKAETCSRFSKHCILLYLITVQLSVYIYIYIYIYIHTHTHTHKKESSPVTGLEWPRGFQEVKFHRCHDNGTGWW